MYLLGIQATGEALSKFDKSMINVARNISKKRLALKLLTQLSRGGYGIPELVEFDEENCYINSKIWLVDY